MLLCLPLGMLREALLTSGCSDSGFFGNQQVECLCSVSGTHGWCHQNDRKNKNSPTQSLVLENSGITLFLPGWCSGQDVQQKPVHPLLALVVQRKSFHHTSLLLIFQIRQNPEKLIGSIFTAPKVLVFGFLLVIGLPLMLITFSFFILLSISSQTRSLGPCQG